MLTIVWNPSGFHLISVLPKEIKFDTSHYVFTIDSFRKALLEAVGHILEGIEKFTIDRVFIAWMERLDRCTTTDREYVE
jgi:diaminopimelate epimerase